MNNINHLFKQLHLQSTNHKKYVTLKKIGISLLWFIFWLLIYGVCVFIQPELVFIPMLLNLPLATFFCIGIILQFLSIFIFHYPESYDVLVKFLVLFFSFSLNFIYRNLIFQNPISLGKIIKFRAIEFLLWLIPWLITILFLGTIVRLTQ